MSNPDILPENPDKCLVNPDIPPENPDIPSENPDILPLLNKLGLNDTADHGNRANF
ncbi:hypothetical protein [Neobacillus piezotolerans]|uniref:hypothetical protein n=1 Tax=Neobacillus piezotolerans TaxID=2259171 RepID=UPI0015F14F6D|nr:hypothetical protein [Neobacillus piezotolerans]